MKSLNRYLLMGFLSLFLLLQGCSNVSTSGYVIGIDPDFFPLNFQDQEATILAFTTELLTMVGEETGVDFSWLNLSWDNLTSNLERGVCQAIISPMPDNLINRQKFAFSDPILRTGAVLVVSMHSEAESLEMLNGELVAIDQTNSQLAFLSEYPDVDFTFYESVRLALEKTKLGQYEACLVPVIPAMTYVHNIFHDSLQIVTHPLTDDALRLVVLEGEDMELLDLFNEGLYSLIHSGKYHALLQKWSII